MRVKRYISHLSTSYPQVIHKGLRGFQCMLSGFFNVLSVSSCILCAALAIYAARRAIRGPESQDRRLRSVELRLQSTETSLDALSTELQALANRVKMQRVRNATEHGIKRPSDDELPDPTSQPDAWRSAMNRRLAFNQVRKP